MVSLLASVAVLSLSTSAYAFASWNPLHSLSKRDLPANSDGFTIPLSTDAQGRYVASIGMVSRFLPMRARSVAGE